MRVCRVESDPTSQPYRQAMDVLFRARGEIVAMAGEVDSGFGGKPFGIPEWDALVRELNRDDPSYAE